ncbi:MAG: serpin family protein [Phycisphaeraceae bacterium]
MTLTRLLIGSLVLFTSSNLALARGENDARELAACSNSFGINLYQHLATGPGNVFISPHSMHAVLSMTLLGAKGPTAEQIASVLTLVTMEHLPAQDGLPAPWIKKLMPEMIQAYPLLLGGTPNMAGINPREDDKDRGFQLKTVNTVWAQKGYPFRKEYLDSLKGTFDSGLREVDFVQDPEGSRTTINAWVQEETKDKIKDLLPKGIIDQLTRLVLTNAVYFKADWISPFAKEATKDAPFTLADGKSVDVPTMHQAAHFQYFENVAVQGVTLPYQGKQVSMTIVLPRKAAGLAEVEKDLTADGLGNWIKDAKRRKVVLALPRFKFESSYDMIPPLKKLGMVDAFVPGKADFSGIDGTRELYVTAVVHKTFVAVDEKGTEAAAATAVVIGLRSAPMPEETVEFKADHPFMFVIRHEPTGTILFMGRMTDPTE